MLFCYLKRIALFLYFLFACIYCISGQDFSNKGKEFWIPYSYHARMTQNNGNGVSMTLYLSSDVSTSYNIEIYNSTGGPTILQTGTINAGGVIVFTVPNLYFLVSAGIINDKAIRVSSGKPIVVYSYITYQSVSSATVCLPTSVLGNEYYSMNYTQVANACDANSYITIIATEDNTMLEITPNVPTENNLTVGVPNILPTPLQKGQIYQIKGALTTNVTNNCTSSSGYDLTGTKIRSVAVNGASCKRIAVFSGSGRLFINGGNNCGNSSDNLYQQLYPVSTWGKEFLTASSYNRPYNIYRVMRRNVSTEVYINNSSTPIPASSYTNGIFYEFSSSQPCRITANEPISVAQYFTTQGCFGNGTPYDPEMIIINPVEQNISKVTLVSSNLVAVASRQHHIHIIMPNSGTGISSFRLDGNPISSSLWSVHPQNSNYSYAYLSNVTQGYHTLASDSGFNALAYGYANAESYGYSAGTNVKDLYQFISIETPTATVDFPATCIGTPFYFSMTFPYQPTSLTWDFGTSLNSQGVSNVTLTAPTPTSTIIVNGKTLYVYKLPTQYSISTAGIYAIKVLAVNPTPDGCGGEQEINFDFEVLPRPTASFTSVGACVGNPIQFTGTADTGARPISSVTWNFGNSNSSTSLNPSFIYTEAGNYTVTYSVITDIGCLSDTARQIVAINPLPTASISGNATTCLNAAQPLVTFTGLGGIAPYTFTFTINGGSPQSVTTIGTSNTASVVVPTNSLGSFQYSLVSVSESGTGNCNQNQVGSVIVTINTNPTATIEGTNTVCKDAISPQVNFTGAGGNPPYTFSYNINNGPTQTISTTPSSSSVSLYVPTSTTGTFVYNLTGVVDVNNTVCSGSSTGSATVTVNALPSATIAGTSTACLNTPSPAITFTGANGTAPYTFTYSVNGGPSQTITTTTGSSVQLFAPTNTVGTFVYTLLSVTDAGSTICSQLQSGTATITVWPLPTAGFTTNSPVCQEGFISFTDQSTANVGNITSWQWNFDDLVSGSQNTSTAQNPTHQFLNAGSFTVSLTVTTSNGCVSTNTIPALVVYPKPAAGFIIPEVCLNDTYAQFTDTSSAAMPGAITQWLWNFGDPNATSANPNTSTLQNPQHSYAAVGSYQVELMVNTNYGCRDTIVQQLVVNGSFPVANFTVNQPALLCANDSVRITDASTVFPGVITKIEIWWDNIGAPTTVYVENNPVAGQVFSHRYPNFQSPLTKNYQIRYRAYSGGVCMNEKLTTITVNAAPSVQFYTIPPICFDAPPYTILQASETGGINGTSVFNGPGVSSGGVFSPAIAGAGEHTLQYLFTSSVGNCKDSATQTIKVWERALANFTVTTNPVCERQIVTFTDNSSSTEGTLTEWRWDFGDGSPVVIRNSPAPLTHTYNTYGIFTVKLLVVTSNGCVSAEKTMLVIVNPLARPNFSFPAISCLPNANVQFSNLSTVPNTASSTLSYVWNFGDPGSGLVNTATSINPSHVYVTLGPYSVNLQATTAEGCVHDTTILLNTLHPQPQASFSTDYTDVCVGSPFLITSTSDPADGTIFQYNWDMGDGSIRNLGSFSYIYADAGSFVVSHFIINSFGCRSNLFTKTVFSNPYPEANAGPDRLMLEGGQCQLTPPNNYPMPVSFSWTPVTYLDDPTKLDVIATPPDDIRYLLTVTTNKGCSDTSSMFIKVLKDPPVPNIFSPNGDGVHDTWVIPFLDSYPGCTVEIVNRYGYLIYRSVGYATPWDGKVNGKDVPVGTYYYVIDPKNGRAKKAGFVDIIR